MLENNGKKTVEVDFLHGDKVWIDGCPSITATIVEILIYRGRTVYAASWINNGSAHSQYFDAFRLQIAE